LLSIFQQSNKIQAVGMALKNNVIMTALSDRSHKVIVDANDRCMSGAVASKAKPTVNLAHQEVVSI